LKKYKEINLEDIVSSCDEALRIIKNEIKNGKSNKVGCIMFIHGYGSSGKGGIIRVKARQWLNAQVRNGVIKAVVNGEDFNIFNFKALELKNQYKELEPLLRVVNTGVTVVEL
jgi:hypothetical protein